MLQGYRENFQPSKALPAPRASLAVRALCADTEAAAQRHSASFALMRVRFEKGIWGPVPSVDEALAYPYGPLERARAEAILTGAAHGAPGQVQARLEAMARAHGQTSWWWSPSAMNPPPGAAPHCWRRRSARHRAAGLTRSYRASRDLVLVRRVRRP